MVMLLHRIYVNCVAVVCSDLLVLALVLHGLLLLSCGVINWFFSFRWNHQLVLALLNNS